MKGILCNITHFAVPTPFKTYFAITAYTATVPATNAYTILVHQPFLIMIITFVVLGAIIIVLASRIIEVFMYLSIAPIPMATMMNRDWGEIGKSWLRNILALAFQGFFIVVALTIFKVLLLNVINEMTAIAPASLPSGSAQNTVTAATITGSMTMIFGYIVALIFTIFRSSNIAKSVFSAH